MIRLLRILIGLAVIWSIYWAVAGYGLKQSVAHWFQAQTQRGWQAEYSDLSLAGYPTRHQLELSNLALADPQNGTAWQADGLTLSSPAIWPGRQTLTFPDSAQRFSYFDQTVVLNADDMVAQLFLHPGSALELQQLGLTSNGWALGNDGGEIMAANSLTVSMIQTDLPEAYDFEISADRFTPGTGLRQISRSQDSLPSSFETLTIQMAVTFDAAWNRFALEDQRPQPRYIDLKLADLHWGALRLKAAGTVSVDALGIPTGELAIQAENWRDMLAMASSAGVLPTQAVNPAERVLTMLAGLGGNPNTLDVKLGFRDGFVTLGPLPLGPAPRIILR